MTLRITFRPGEPIADQLVYAVKRAVIAGEYLPGQAFPSVRALAGELKIHPNTAHKAIQYLIQERFLEARPGIGTVVAQLPEARKGDRNRLLKEEVERLVVESRRVGLDLDTLLDAVERQWAALEPSEEVKRK